MGVLIYQQRSGVLSLHSARLLEYAGYSGKGAGRNNPKLQYVRNVGPIPQGVWKLGQPYSSPSKGPLCIPLLPCAGTDPRGRSGFLIHGDNRTGDASEGCIIVPRWMREAIIDDGARFLIVLDGSMEAQLAA